MAARIAKLHKHMSCSQTLTYSLIHSIHSLTYKHNERDFFVCRKRERTSTLVDFLVLLSLISLFATTVTGQ